MPLAFAFGGFTQIIAGFLEYKNASTFGMVAFTVYGAFWWWYTFLLWSTGAGWIKAPNASGVAAFAPRLVFPKALGAVAANPSGPGFFA